MPKAQYIQTNFTAGEVSPRLEGRVDFAKYVNAVKTMENMTVLPHGGAVRRGGSRHITTVKTASKKVRLVSFEFSVEQAYILEFGDLYIRFYKDKGQIQSGSPAAAVEVVSPYTEAQLFELSFTQSADTLYIVHKSHEPRILTRTSHTAWTLSTFQLIAGPFLPVNTTSTTIAPSGTTGNITLTASSTTGINGGAGFSTADVGRLVQIDHSDTFGHAKITGYTSSTLVDATVQDDRDFGATSADVDWALGHFYVDNWPTVVAFYENRLAFSGAPNNPQTLTFSQTDDYSNMLAGDEDNEAMVYTIATDQVNAIRWMNPGQVLVVGTAGGEFVVSASASNEALTPTNVRVVRQTTYGSYAISSLRISDVVLFLQRAQRKIREFVFQFTSDSYVAPDLSILSEHITESGVVEIDYQQEPNSVIWCVLTDGTLVGMTYQRDQDVVAWHKQILAGVSATDGTQAKVESVAVIPAPTGGADNVGRDELWVAVQRYVNGGVVRHIEVIEAGLEDPNSQEEAFFVDSGLSLNNPITITGATAADPVVITAASHGLLDTNSVDIRGVAGMTELNNRRFTVANKTTNTFELSGENGLTHTTYISGGTARLATTAISGLSHLEGESVIILGNGAVQPSKTVSSGAITLETAASIVHAGLPYTSKLITLNLEAGSADGTAQGKSKRITEVTVRLYRSLGIQVGPEGGPLDIIPFRDSSDLMNSPPALYTGDKYLAYPQGHDTGGNVEIQQTQPLPLTLIALILRLKTND